MHAHTLFRVPLFLGFTTLFYPVSQSTFQTDSLTTDTHMNALAQTQHTCYSALMASHCPLPSPVVRLTIMWSVSVVLWVNSCLFFYSGPLPHTDQSAVFKHDIFARQYVAFAAMKLNNEPFYIFLNVGNNGELLNVSLG